jgi:ABC-type amino acid transport substrate-binding protein
VAGFVVNERPYGIGLRKDDADLQQAVLGAVTAMYADRSIHRILEKWDLSEVAVADPSHVRLNGGLPSTDGRAP